MANFHSITVIIEHVLGQLVKLNLIKVNFLLSKTMGLEQWD